MQILKPAAPVLALAALALSGCAMNRPPMQSPDEAWNTYKGRLAEQCSAKHLDTMSPEKFNEIARDFYIDADTQNQQLIDADARKACGSRSITVDCYNTGFVQAQVQVGSTQEFVKKVCSKS